ncbi:hypothetical protein HYD55_02430 [Mycoplasmopsis bovis]|nr:hypothetical protein [Mycoplasmopsis bovis]QQH71618.1 hypothetical protein HYD55_02430 [Mycoplasmopsis bovis]
MAITNFLTLINIAFVTIKFPLSEDTSFRFNVTFNEYFQMFCLNLGNFDF